MKLLGKSLQFDILVHHKCSLDTSLSKQLSSQISKGCEIQLTRSRLSDEKKINVVKDYFKRRLNECSKDVLT